MPASPSWNTPRVKGLSVAAGVLHLVICLSLVAVGITTVWNQHPASTTVVPPAYLHSVWGLLVGFTAVTAFFHLVVYPHVAYAAPAALADGKNPWRFLEYGFTASAMLVVIAILSGVQEPGWLAALAAASALVMFLGYVVEQTDPADRWRTGVYTILAWTILLGAYGTVFYRFLEVAQGDVQPPAFVYALVICMFLLFCCFGVVQLVWVVRKGKGGARYEYAYLVLSVVAKTLLVGLTASGVPPLLSRG